MKENVRSLNESYTLNPPISDSKLKVHHDFHSNLKITSSLQKEKQENSNTLLLDRPPN